MAQTAEEKRTAFVQLTVIMLFIGLCATIFGYLWVNSGGKLPFISKENYRLSASIPRIGNLVYFSDVAVHGVLIGKVVEITERGDHAHVVMDLTKYTPIHEGAKVRVRAKTLVEESFLEIEDGTGPALPSGSELPKEAGFSPTQLNDVLLALDGKTRGALSEASKSLGAATAGSREAWSDAVKGLGAIGRGGHDALDALAAQSEDLRELSANTASVLNALNTQPGQIAQLVTDANRLTTATSEGREDLAQFVRELPPTLKAAEDASDSITRLGNALDPVAKNLRQAAPDLTAALNQLPEVSDRLRALLPVLDSVLEKGPATLDRVDTFAGNASELADQGSDSFAELNPMLGYIAQYKREVAGFGANIAQWPAHGDANGKAIGAMIVYNDVSAKGVPVNTQVGPFDKFNPYPLPGQGYNPSGVGRNFERLEREGN